MTRASQHAQHTLDEAHPSDIFALLATPTSIISGSGSPSIKIHSTSDPFDIVQSLTDAHPLGIHHLALSGNKKVLASAGFDGRAKIWTLHDSVWQHATDLAPTPADKKSPAGELWAIALDQAGRYLAGTTYDGRVNVWELGTAVDEKTGREHVKARWFTGWETKGSFGLAVDLSPDDRFTATGHASGNIYVHSTTTTRLLHSLPTQGAPVRCVRFSPGSSLLAVAGDSRIISLYDANSGEQVANLTGHEAWITCLDWSATGEYLLSGALDGKVKVWSVDTRNCVATMSESDKGLWAVRWLPKAETSGDRIKAERFVTGGNSRAIAIYREASGAA